jgi:hypothetical protein
MTFKQLPFPVTSDVVWESRIAAAVRDYRANGVREFGIEVQQAGLQKVLYKLQQHGFVPYTTIKTEPDIESGVYDIERYVLVLRDKFAVEIHNE